MIPAQPPTTAGPGARCGQCGYSAIGLTTLRCPECGGDFRSVGLRGERASTRKTGSVPSSLFTVALYTVVLAAAAWGSTALVLQSMPAGHAYCEEIHLTTSTGLNYLLSAKVWYTFDRVPMVPVNLQVVGASKSSRVIDSAKGSVESMDAAGRHLNWRSFNADVCRAWLAENKIVDPIAVAVIPNRVMQMSRPDARVVGYQWTSSESDPHSIEQSTIVDLYGPPPGTVGLCVAGWLVLWFACGRLLWREMRAITN